jgi:chemotaxis protein histidine kinase CheA
LGLPRALRLIEQNRGSLRIDSSPGQGTSVTVTLPTSVSAD